MVLDPKGQANTARQPRTPSPGCFPHQPGPRYVRDLCTTTAAQGAKDWGQPGNLLGKKVTNVFNYKVISMVSFLLTKALASECKDLPKKEDD